jgi:glycosyltransferase involved in cell wall biosynthesis
MGPTPGGEDTPLGPDGLGISGPDNGLRARLSIAEAEAERLRAHVDAIESLASKLGDQELELARVNAELRVLRSSRVLRTLTRARRFLIRLRGTRPSPEQPVLVLPSLAFPNDIRYPAWIESFDLVDAQVRASLQRRLASLAEAPLVSVILPVFNTPERYLRAAIDSVRAQIYDNWELCIVDDGSTAAWVPKVLSEYSTQDGRIKVERRSVNGHISISSNTAVAMATGSWLALFDHDDILAEHALALSVLSLAEQPDAGMLYSDEDHIDDAGNRSAPYFKPEFDPLLLLGQNYFSHLSMFRRDLVLAVGGFREGYEGSQDWDLVLRISRRLRPDQIIHVPHVLYHWRAHSESTASSLMAKPYAAVAAQRAVKDHLSESGQHAKVSSIGVSSFNRIHWTLPAEPPGVSVIVLPRSGVRLLRCLDSIRVRSTYPDIELVLVDDGDRRPPLRELIRDQSGTVTVVREERGGTDGALRNAGARAARGEVLCFVHDDIEITTDHWLDEMVGLLLQPGIGAVGAKLLYPDGLVQHAGIVGGIGSTVGNVHRFTDRLEPGYCGRAMLTQSFSAVSWACMVVRREAFEAVNGFDEVSLSGAFGDVDFCYRLGEAGWRVGWTPHAEVLHHESPKDARETEGENAVRFARDIRHLRTRWRAMLDGDPAYNPNLTLAHENFALAWPPRVSLR